LAEELWLTEVQMKAVLDEQVMSLGDVLNWRPGSKYMLNATADSGIDMRVGDISMFKGRMGRKRQHIAVRVDEKLIGEKM
jgi:flagellar motor switch protein FliM